MGVSAPASYCDSHSVLRSHHGAACVPCGWTDLGAGAFVLTLCVPAAGTAGESWAVQYRVFKGLPKKGPHLNVSGWATNMPSYF